MEQQRLLAPFSQRELRFLKEQALDCPFAGPTVSTDVSQGVTFAGICQNPFRDAHRSRVDRTRQLQWAGRSRLQLIQQGSDQVSAIRSVFGPDWCFANENNELF
jgi:hypothetical protein